MNMDTGHEKYGDRQVDVLIFIFCIIVVIMAFVNPSKAQVNNQFQYKWLKTQTFDKNIDIKDTLKFNIQTNPNLFISRDGIYLDSGHFMLRAGFNNRYHTTRDRQGINILTNDQGDSASFIINAKSRTYFQHVNNSDPIIFRFMGAPEEEVLRMYNDTMISKTNHKFEGSLYDSQGDVLGTSEALVGSPPKKEKVAIAHFQKVDLDFPTIQAGDSQEISVSISEVTTESSVVVTESGGVISGFSTIIVSSFIPANGTLVIRAYNISPSQPEDPDPMSFSVTILKEQS